MFRLKICPLSIKSQPISPATTSNPYNYLFEFVEVAGLIGLTGIKIKKYVNSNSGAGSLDLFSGVTTGVIIIVMNNPSAVGHKNNIAFVRDANNLLTNDFNAGSDHHYQVLSISNGRVSISNTGYGVGVFTAYWLS